MLNVLLIGAQAFQGRKRVLISLGTQGSSYYISFPSNLEVLGGGVSIVEV